MLPERGEYPPLRKQIISTYRPGFHGDYPSDLVPTFSEFVDYVIDLLLNVRNLDWVDMTVGD